MTYVTKGIGLGIGFVLGSILMILFITLLIILLWELYKFSVRHRFSPALFYRYGNELLRHERFEELERVKNIIDQLERNEKPKDLSRYYRVRVDSDLVWVADPNGGERLRFQHQKRIVPKPKKTQNKPQQNTVD